MLRWAPGVQEGVDAALASDLEACLGALPGRYVAVEGHRSAERADALHAAFVSGEGPRAALAADSAHCCTPAFAIDVQLENAADGAVWYPDMEPGEDPNAYQLRCPEGWRALWAAVWRAPRLHSLWTLGDGDHIERLHWRLECQRESQSTTHQANT